MRFRRFVVVAVVTAMGVWAAIAAPAGAGQVRPPTNVSARAVSGPQIELAWDQLTAADGFASCARRPRVGPTA